MAGGDGSHAVSVMRVPILERMQRIWWYVIGGVVVLGALLTVLGFALFTTGGDDGGPEASGEVCTPQKGSPAAGNSNVDARALGKGYARQIVIRVTDKKSGAPVRGAQVSVRGTMDCPHFMPLYQKDLREASSGTYRGDYQLVMQGHWIFHVVVRSEQNGATTASFPLTLNVPG
jgi:YtkA-like